MEENHLRVFVEGSTNYFQEAVGTKARIGVPYLIDEKDPVVFEYTGIIGISGTRRGSVYFTAHRPLIRALLIRLQVTEFSEENICDLVGEVANTIAGNAQRVFGRSFMISVPVVVTGADNRITLAKDVKSYAIPVEWENYRAALVVSLV